MTTRKPLRILMVSHVPLVRELGAGRVQLELAEELRQLGHEVGRFDIRDAFGSEMAGRRNRLRPLRFARAASAYVRAHGSRFDVVDAQQGTLPYSKKGDLNFNGLLVARSVGLFELYEEWRREERRRWPNRIPGTWLGRVVQAQADRRAARACRDALVRADLVIVPTADERRIAEETLGVEHCIALPFGLSRERIQSLVALHGRRAVDGRRPIVAVVGAWSLRKGAGDWREICRRTRVLVPGVQFRFLGTGVAAESVKAMLEAEDAAQTQVVPSYLSEELPKLLAEASVAGFASYVEGWPFAVMETLAAGLPTVAYDAPGARTILAELRRSLLVPRGDVHAFADLLAQTLSLPNEAYAGLSRASVTLVKAFRWREIAEETVTGYRLGLQRLRDDG